MNKLQKLLTAHQGLPAQGTAEWLAGRRYRLGGSEMAAALGVCPYRSREKLVEEKVHRQFTGSAACTFGTLFEPIAKHYIRKQEDVTIWEMGSVPHETLPIAYSPDGLIVKNDTMILLEIKCPFQRRKYDVVPKQYFPQINTGMEVLDCPVSWFYQLRFRLCKLQDIGPNPRFNRWLHYEGRNKVPDEVPTGWGYVHFEAPCPLDDLGKLGRPDMDVLMDFRRLPHKVYYETADLPNGGVVMGFKLFEVTRHEVQRDEGYLERHKEQIMKVAEMLNE